MANKYHNYRERSKETWGISRDERIGDGLNFDQIQIGAILRIADASERMAANHVALQNDRDMYKRWYEQEKQENKRLRNQANGLRGYISRLKKK